MLSLMRTASTTDTVLSKKETASSVSLKQVVDKHLSYMLLIKTVDSFFLVELKSSVKTNCKMCRARGQLLTCSFSSATLSPVCWVARSPTKPPVPATASHRGGKSERHLTTWPRPPGRRCTEASIRTFTASASRPSPCRAGRRGPVIPRTTQARAHTVQRGLTVTSPGLPPTL